MGIFYFFLVFIYSISNVYYANIFFYFIFFSDIVKRKGRIKLIANSHAKFYLFSFIIWVTISTFLYALYKNSFDVRSVIQYLFTLQYLILIVSINMDFKSLESWVFRFSVVQAAIIVFVAIVFMIEAQDYSLGILYNNEFAYKYFPGWPNTIPIPLIISLLFSFRNKKPVISKILLILGLILTTSRGAYLGVIFVLVYFVFERIKSSKKSLIIVILGLIITVFIGGFVLSENPVFVSQMLRSYDRVDIFRTTIEYIKLNPILGYGGNTIEQLQDVKINFIPVKNWGHTHNWVLEILLRYGIVGFSLFLGFIVSLWLKIKNKDQRFMFAVFIFLAFFQTFMRDFVFIFYLAYLSNNSEKIY